MLEFDDLGLGIASHSKNLGLILCFHLLCFNNKGKQSKLEIISPHSNVSVIQFRVEKEVGEPSASVFNVFHAFKIHKDPTEWDILTLL